jgi:hypothetical protein
LLFLGMDTWRLLVLDKNRNKYYARNQLAHNQ